MSTPNARPSLALAIPTYNRSAILEENLRSMLPDLRQHGIPIYISDDSTDDHTAHMVSALAQEYPYITYRRNEPRLNHDANFFATIAMPDTDFVWYLGDSLFVKPGGVERVLRSIENHPDFCFVNAYAEDLISRAIAADEVHGFLLDRSWYLTLTGATVYGRRPRQAALGLEQKQAWRNFPQLGLVLHFCSQHAATMYWLGESCLGLNRKKSSYWLKTAVAVFATDWSNFIRSFPALFAPEEAKVVIRSHAVHTHLFDPIGLIRLRALGGLNFSILKKHRDDFATASPLSPIWAYLICLLPKTLLQLLSTWSTGIRRHFRQKADGFSH